MKQDEARYSVKEVMRRSAKACLVAAVALTMCMAGNESAQATTGVGPYEVPLVKDADNDPNNHVVETWIVAEEATVDIGNGVTAKAMAYKSCSDAKLRDCTTPAIPGPEFRLEVNDQVIVHFVNKLSKSRLTPEAHVSGIHWHGIELNNQSDGTELTQHAVDPNGGTFDYNFTVPRPGIFWYHPHHHGSTNQVAKGLYGSLIVKDPNETGLIGTTLPSVDQTKTLVLSDITVCKEPGSNPATFDSSLPHVSGINNWQSNYQVHEQTQSPFILCEADPLDANGGLLKKSYRAGDVPNIQEPSLIGRMSEGFTVLTNGMTVGARAGDPASPGALGAGASTLDVLAGQGLRLQIVNPSPVRYMRLRLTEANGSQVNLYRVGGEGGLLNNPVLEGGIVLGVNFKYDQGEILVPPAGRADVVAAIPASATGVLTLWQEDFQRVAATYSWTPTVPVMHLAVSGSVTGAPYTISTGTSLGFVTGLVGVFGSLDDPNDDPNPETPYEVGGSAGSTNPDIQLTFINNNGALQPSIEGVGMPRDFTGGFGTGNPFYLASARHATLGSLMALTVTNTTGANHPFHLHGFSFQPISLTTPEGVYNFPIEFRDIVDVPAFSTLTFYVSLADRPGFGATSGVGGGTGRWLFHCHILPHATFGMMSELHVGAH